MEIEKIVTTKYKVDGILFDDYEQAERWKRYIEGKNFFRMYDSNGEVDNARFASFVCLKGETSAKKFIEQAEKDESEYEGIYEGDTGFFFWDNWNDKYQKIDSDTLYDAYKIYRTYIEEKE